MRWRGKRAESRDEGQPFYLWRERYKIDYYTVHYAMLPNAHYDTTQTLRLLGKLGSYRSTKAIYPTPSIAFCGECRSLCIVRRAVVGGLPRRLLPFFFVSIINQGTLGRVMASDQQLQVAIWC